MHVPTPNDRLRYNLQYRIYCFNGTFRSYKKRACNWQRSYRELATFSRQTKGTTTIQTTGEKLKLTASSQFGLNGINSLGGDK